MRLKELWGPWISRMLIPHWQLFWGSLLHFSLLPPELDSLPSSPLSYPPYTLPLSLSSPLSLPLVYLSLLPSLLNSPNLKPFLSLCLSVDHSPASLSFFSLTFTQERGHMYLSDVLIILLCYQNINIASNMSGQCHFCAELSKCSKCCQWCGLWLGLSNLSICPKCWAFLSCPGTRTNGAAMFLCLAKPWTPSCLALVVL